MLKKGTEEMEKAICTLSGGMDSLTCTAIAIHRGYEVYLLHLSYGQRTELRELKAFCDIADFYSIPAERRLVISVDYLEQIGGSSLTDKSISVSKADLDYKGIPSSYVPFRNAHFLSIAVSWAEVIGASKIYIGANEVDSSGYRDCRIEFVYAFNRLILQGTSPGTDIEVVAPIIHMRKSEIIKSAIAHDAPLNLSWSCYQNVGHVACGVCDSCALRLRGFKEIGVRDPIKYEDDKVRDLY